ncbi:NACHT, LRR and PYD domains-containing protein 12-like isoform X2 [Hydra vulgaris]|uniref:NACHT, LRR and PYD domains-containing protein 12-like isoform X2 n=1 Tax=Hydra vulgaris TaxID=6087 RepID=A0ABM4DA42_HYDVU
MDENILQYQQYRYEFSLSVGKYWRDLGQCLSVDDCCLDVIDHENKYCYEKAYQMLTKWLEMTPNPSLNDLKKALETMKNQDLIDKLQINSSEVKESSSREKDILSNALKNYYLETYKTIDEIQSPLNTISKVNFLDKFVNLYVVDAVKVQKDAIYIAERDQFLKKQMSYPSLLFEKHLIDPSLFLISGIAAIGKTWLLRKCLLDWSKGLIWKKIDFVFYFECRKLNLHESISDINQLLNVFYKDIFKSVSFDFNQFKPSIMFIIDGLNEFKYFDQFINSTQCSSDNFPIVNVLSEIHKYKAVISGRINTISQYENVITSCRDKLTIRVMGYNESGINYYLENNLIKNTKDIVENILEESLVAKSMATVPFFLSCMCTIVADFKENYNFRNLTMADLYANNFLYFFQRHIFMESHKPVFRMMENDQNKKYIFNICKMAYCFFIESKATFSSAEMQKFLSDFDLIEKDFVFIEKIVTDYGVYYQFCQLAMMELCVSIYAYYSFSGNEIMKNPKLNTCLSIICGLLNKNEYSFIKYLANLTNPHTEKISLNHVINVKTLERVSLIRKHLLIVIQMRFQKN